MIYYCKIDYFYTIQACVKTVTDLTYVKYFIWKALLYYYTLLYVLHLIVYAP